MLIVVGWVAAATAACGGTAKQAGREAAEGALTKLERESQRDPSQPFAVAERTAHGLVRGTLSEMNRPEQSDQLNTAVRSASASATAGGVEGALSALRRPDHMVQLELMAREAASAALDGLARPQGSADEATMALIANQAARGVVDVLGSELGPGGEGPLAKNLYATTERMSASAARGFGGEIGGVFPGCQGPDRERCIEQRVTDLARAAAVGMGDGLRGLVAVPLLILAFVLGLVIAFAIAWLASRRRAVMVR
jgi:hypothetical protein